MVYVTVSGSVYHKKLNCSHLNLSVTKVSGGNVSSRRNENGEKYHACESCSRGQAPGSTVYITKSGNRYHNDKNCSGLKRSVRLVKESEAGNLHACKRCGINSWKDIRTREVSLLSIVVFGIVGMVRTCFLRTVSVDLVWNVCMGVAVIGLSIISKGAVGMGDGLLFLSLGTVLPFEELLSAFLLGLFCCCFWGIVVLFLSGKGKKTEMPFVPFLMLGYIGGLIY